MNCSAVGTSQTIGEVALQWVVSKGASPLCDAGPLVFSFAVSVIVSISFLLLLVSHSLLYSSDALFPSSLLIQRLVLFPNVSYSLRSRQRQMPRQ